MKVLAVTLMIFGFVSPAAAQFVSQFDSPDLKGGKVHVSRIVLTPVTAFVSQLDWKNQPFEPGKPMEAESRQLEKDLLPVVAAKLKSLGFIVNDASLSPESIAASKDLGDKVKLVQSAFRMEDSETQAHRKRDATEPVSLGDTVLALHVPDDSDAIVVIQVRDFIETKGKKFMNAVPGTVPRLQSTGGWDLEIGIVDAKTGAILYIARSDGSNDIAKEPEKAGPKIEKSFKDFFKYNAASTGPLNPKL
jgi:hypothetical protein